MRRLLLTAIVLGLCAGHVSHVRADPEVRWRGPPTPTQVRMERPDSEKETSVLSVGDSYDDFPSIVEDRDGIPYVAYTAYREGRDEMRLHRRMPDGGWSQPVSVPAIAPEADIWMPQLAVDGSNRLWVIWSEQVGASEGRAGNWDLYARALSGRRWGSPVRLTSDPKPDINHRVIADADGKIYVVWQAHPKNDGDIYLRQFDGSDWSQPLAVTSGPGSDWFPDVAVDEAGTVWIAFDSYRFGDYDVFLTSVRAGEVGSIVPIARSPYFEANASVAAAGAGEVWVAWEQRGPHWGKDRGFAVPSQTTTGSLLGTRGGSDIRVVRVEADALLTAPPLAAALAEGPSNFLAMPGLVMDSERRLWLRFRRRREFDGESGLIRHQSYWTENVASLGAGGWVHVMELPESAGRLAVFNSLLAMRNGGLLAAYSADKRHEPRYFAPVRDRISVARLASPVSDFGIPELAAYRPPGPPKGRWDRSAEAADVRRMRAFRIPEGGGQQRILRGDLHRHTEFSWDAPRLDGTLFDAYRYLIDVADLDFGAITDHQGGIHPYWLWLTGKAADLYHLPPRFVSLFGYERSVNFPHGHRNIFHDHRGVSVFPFQMLEEPDLADPPIVVRVDQALGRDRLSLYDALRRTGGLAIPHTTATAMGTDWRVHDAAIEPVVEIYQGARNSYEMLGGPRADDGKSSPDPEIGFRAEGFVSNALARGYRLGFIASSDHASTHVSYAMVYSESNDRRSIMQALRRRAAYAATDNILLEFRSDGHLMGEEYATAVPPTLALRAFGTDQIARVDLIHNGRVTYTESPKSTREVEIEYRDEGPAAGQNYYYFRLVQRDGEVAWASPVWVELDDGNAPQGRPSRSE